MYPCNRILIFIGIFKKVASTATFIKGPRAKTSINIQCKDPDVKPVTNDLVLSTTIVTV